MDLGGRQRGWRDRQLRSRNNVEGYRRASSVLGFKADLLYRKLYLLHAYANEYPYADSNAHTNANTHAEPDRDTYWDANSYSDEHTKYYTDKHSLCNAYRHSNQHSY